MIRFAIYPFLKNIGKTKGLSYVRIQAILLIQFSRSHFNWCDLCLGLLIGPTYGTATKP